jgi:predicted exporter
VNRLPALLWLAIVLSAATYLAWRVETGLTFRTDLMALLPTDQQDAAMQKASETVTKTLSRQLVLLTGDPDRTTARAAAQTLSDTLKQSGLFTPTNTTIDTDRIQRIGALYAPYRAGLLSDPDRDLLTAHKGTTIATRALSQVFGFIGLGDAHLLQTDPFLLMPSFFANLPLPMSSLTQDDGMLSTTQDGKTWILTAGELTQEPYALDTQRRLSAILDPTIQRLRTQHPALETLRLGAVFFAQAGADQAIGETSLIGIVSTIGTILVVLAAFRALTPLWLSLLVIGTGIMTALSGSMLLFGDLHVGAMLFGTSLIGVAVDYSLQYCTEIFTHEPSPHTRLRQVLWGITLGTATTVIGYLTLLLAPFPGLRQVAVFSAIGLAASWLTVVLWLPALDRGKPAQHGASMLRWSFLFLWLWQSKRLTHWRRAALATAILLAAIGLVRFHTDDDVRRMQALSPDLLAQQSRLQTLIGSQGGGQFFLISAPDTETALRTEETLADRLRPLISAGALANFRSPARYVPSAQRQQENRALIAQELNDSARREQFRRLGLPPPDSILPANPNVLTLPEAMHPGTPLQFLSLLVLNDSQGATSHVVMLDGVHQLNEVAAAADGLQGVRFIDPAGSFSTVLGKYRNRTMMLLALSALLMAPLLACRYGPRRTIWIMLPPILAVALTPGLRALFGAGFTFFDGIALVLILSVGVDYAVFLAETSRDRRTVTMLAVALAATTALMSFGLLALSNVQAVQHFGATMLVGILLAAVLAPMARR